MRAAPLALLAVIGCGDGLRIPEPLDAPVIEDGLVSVTYRGIRSPDGWPVYFQNADSSLVLATRTDPGGHANAFMAGGGFVTVVVGHENMWSLHTIAGVEPGDELVVDESSIAEADTELILRIGADEDSTLYFLETDCGGQNVSSATYQAVLVRVRRCLPSADMLVVSYNLEPRYQLRTNVTIPPLGIVTMAEAYRRFESSPATATNIPSEITGIVVSKALIGQTHALFSPAAEFLVPIDGETTAIFQLPLPPGKTTLTRYDGEIASGHSVHQLSVWGPAQRTDVVDYDAVTLPAYAERPRFDASSNTISWRETGTGTMPDAVMASISWDASEVRDYQWHVLTPRTTAASIQLPVLPSPAFRPRGFVSEPFTLTNIAIDGGFDRIRRLPVLGGWQPGLTWPVDSDAGRVDYQVLRSGSPPQR